MDTDYYALWRADSMGLECRTRVFGANWVVASMLMVVFCTFSSLAAPTDYFVIRVVDEKTGRGVPLVELRTTNDVAYCTDSNGVTAFLEPELMNRKVFFTITSPGYEFPADGFGFHGKALQTVSGTQVTLKIRRTNIAERLYRLTGAGIYRDSSLARIPTPRRAQRLNGDVVGQDSVLAVPYHGALHWFWGDTSRPDYPLGNFGTSGAVSPLASNPDRGIEFTYFVDASGFSRPMLPSKEPGPVWVSAVSSVENGHRLTAYYSRIENLSKASERGLAVYNDQIDTFERVMQFDASKPLPLDGHPFLATRADTALTVETQGSFSSQPSREGVEKHGTTYLVGTDTDASPLPWVRVPATVEAMKDLNRYETYTCLRPAQAGAHLQPDRDAGGKLIYAWRRAAPSLTFDRQQKLISTGVLKPDEAPFQLRDIETGKPVRPHSGSVYWNAYRQRWIMIVGQMGGGVSNVGEIWFAEADTAVGPWVYARKIATHPKMDFYNPTQHPFFDEQNGRRIYFEGTYVNTFSGNPAATPRYNYNQILYRLALDDPRLSLPMPVYRLASGAHRLREGLHLPADAADIRAIPFYAIPPTHAHEGLNPIYSVNGDFQTTAPMLSAKPLFYALPPSKTGSANTTPLLDANGHSIGIVWKNPLSVLIFDFSLKPTLSDL